MILPGSVPIPPFFRRRTFGEATVERINDENGSTGHQANASATGSIPNRNSNPIIVNSSTSNRNATGNSRVQETSSNSLGVAWSVFQRDSSSDSNTGVSTIGSSNRRILLPSIVIQRLPDDVQRSGTSQATRTSSRSLTSPRIESDDESSEDDLSILGRSNLDRTVMSSLERLMLYRRLQRDGVYRRVMVANRLQRYNEMASCLEQS